MQMHLYRAVEECLGVICIIYLEQIIFDPSLIDDSICSSLFWILFLITPFEIAGWTANFSLKA